MGKNTIVAAGGVVENEEGALLMIFRRGKWDLPKGKLDKEESIEECAVREVSEETGLTELILGSLIETSYHTYFDPFLQKEMTKETHWYQMRAPGHQVLVPQTEEDITDIRWITTLELPLCLTNTYDNIISLLKKTGR